MNGTICDWIADLWVAVDTRSQHCGMERLLLHRRLDGTRDHNHGGTPADIKRYIVKPHRHPRWLCRFSWYV